MREDGAKRQTTLGLALKDMIGGSMGRATTRLSSGEALAEVRSVEGAMAFGDGGVRVGGSMGTKSGEGESAVSTKASASIEATNLSPAQMELLERW